MFVLDKCALHTQRTSYIVSEIGFGKRVLMLTDSAKTFRHTGVNSVRKCNAANQSHQNENTKNPISFSFRCAHALDIRDERGNDAFVPHNDGEKNSRYQTHDQIEENRSQWITHTRACIVERIQFHDMMYKRQSRGPSSDIAHCHRNGLSSSRPKSYSQQCARRECRLQFARPTRDSNQH